MPKLSTSHREHNRAEFDLLAIHAKRQRLAARKVTITFAGTYLSRLRHGVEGSRWIGGEGIASHIQNAVPICQRICAQRLEVSHNPIEAGIDFFEPANLYSTGKREDSGQGAQGFTHDLVKMARCVISALPL